MTKEANIPVRRGVASHLFGGARTPYRGTNLDSSTPEPGRGHRLHESSDSDVRAPSTVHTTTSKQSRPASASPLSLRIRRCPT
jgi:hypothetical protein